MARYMSTGGETPPAPGRTQSTLQWLPASTGCNDQIRGPLSRWLTTALNNRLRAALGRLRRFRLPPVRTPGECSIDNAADVGYDVSIAIDSTIRRLGSDTTTSFYSRTLRSSRQICVRMGRHWMARQRHRAHRDRQFISNNSFGFAKNTFQFDLWGVTGSLHRRNGGRTEGRAAKLHVEFPVPDVER